MNLSKVACKMIYFIVISAAAAVAAVTVICLVAGPLAAADIIPFAIGILLSTIVSIIKVFMLSRQVEKTGTMTDPSKAKLYTTGQALLRFLLTGAGLIAAHFLPFDNHYALYGAIIGAFTWNSSAYALKFAKIEDEHDTAEKESGTAQ